MKKLLVFTFLLLFAFQGVGLAAKSSSPARTSSPAPKTSTTQKAPTTNAESGYKPSAPAASYSQTAPAAKSTPATVQQPSSGGFMRGLGMFGGGMLLGSMLGGSFGFGSSGMFATLAGLLFNIMLIGGVIAAGRYFWGKYKQRQQGNAR